MEHKQRRKWFRFSLGGLLFVFLCAAGTLAGYRVGYQRGEEAWNSLPLFATVYDVSDSLQKAAYRDEYGVENVSDLVTLIKSRIDPRLFDRGENPPVINELKGEQKFVVGGNEMFHDEVERVIRKLESSIANTENPKTR